MSPCWTPIHLETHRVRYIHTHTHTLRNEPTPGDASRKADAQGDDQGLTLQHPHSALIPYWIQIII